MALLKVHQLVTLNFLNFMIDGLCHIDSIIKWANQCEQNKLIVECTKLTTAALH